MKENIESVIGGAFIGAIVGIFVAFTNCLCFGGKASSIEPIIMICVVIGAVIMIIINLKIQEEDRERAEERQREQLENQRLNKINNDYQNWKNNMTNNANSIINNVQNCNDTFDYFATISSIKSQYKKYPSYKNSMNKIEELEPKFKQQYDAYYNQVNKWIIEKLKYKFLYNITEETGPVNSKISAIAIKVYYEYIDQVDTNQKYIDSLYNFAEMSFTNSILLSFEQYGEADLLLLDSNEFDYYDNNIVSIYDVGVDNGVYYIVMELIQGKTLKEIIVEERGPLPWKWSVNVAIQIASALEMAHKNNIIHRDIKPHNIIITEDGIAKVTDFGIAKAVSNSTITAFGTTIGSVHYFSPEHARGGYTDAKSDLYSLGVVMYEMVTGKVPFDADTPVSVALKHMQEDPVPPIEENKNLPEAVNKIILKALKKDPMLRYQTATEMLQDLRMALKNPSGDFVEEVDYDETARTQKISTNMYERQKKSNGKKENKFITFIKTHPKLSVFLGIIILFFLAFGGTTLVLNVTNPKEVQLPNVVGLSQEEAKQKVESAKLKFEVSAEEYNTEVITHNIPTTITLKPNKT